MKTMKRLGALTLALVMTMTALAGCGGKGASSSPPGSASGASSGADASTQPEAMDLSQVADPYLAVAGVAGDTVVARLGDEDIPASLLLYWTAQTGDADSALEVASVHSRLHLMARQEGLTPDPSVARELEQQYASLASQAGSEALADHILWAQLLTRDLLAYLNESRDLFSQLADLRYGEGSGRYPTDAEVNAYLDEAGRYRVKHILLSTTDENRQPLEDEAVIAQKKATADDLLAQLRAAEDPIALFDELMHQYSEDPGLTSNPEGYTTQKGQMVPVFEETSLALKVGEISEVVDSGLGYHIILRLPMDPDEFRDDCVGWLFQQDLDREQEQPRKEAAFDTLELDGFGDKLQSLQAAVQAELAG